MVRADDSLWHSFVGEMTQHCGLSAFLTNDQIVHAVSKTPLGPWIRQGPLHPFGVSAECPHAIRGPGGEYLVFHTGCGNLSNPNSIRRQERHDCANGTTGPKRTSSSSRSGGGGWPRVGTPRSALPCL